jgi:hypothetical protein
LRTCHAGATPHVVVVEEDGEQAHVLARRFHLFVVVGPDFARRFLDCLGHASVQLDETERFDLLRLAVFGDVEVRLFQIGDLHAALVVADDHVDADEVDAAAEHRRWLWLVGRRLLLSRWLLRRRLLRLLLRGRASRGLREQLPRLPRA